MVKARRRGRIAVGVAGLVLSLASAVAAAPVRSKPPRTLAELIPPPVPEAENAAKLYLRAAALLAEQELEGTPLSQLLVLTQLPPADNLLEAGGSVYGLKPDTREELRTALLDELCASLRMPQVKKALTLVEQASGMPQCRFDVKYEVSPAIMPPHLAEVRSLGKFLAGVTLAKAEAGEMAAAWTCVWQQVQLAEHLRDEPVLISQLVRIALFAIADKGMKGLAEASPPPAKTARALDRLLVRVGDHEPWVAAIHGERLLLLEWLANVPVEDFTKGMEVLGLAQNAQLPTREQMDADHRACQRVLLRTAELMAQPYCQAKTPLAEVLAELTKRNDSNLFGEFFPALDACVRKVASCQAMARVARVGLRLKAYRARHDDYPATLAVLDLADIPAGKRIDPFTGRALTYRTKGQGFLLYSLGPDAADNGGKERQGNEKSGFDVVWGATQ